MTGRARPGVDAYIAQLPEWQQSICEQLRGVVDAIHCAANPVANFPMASSRTEPPCAMTPQIPSGD